MEERGFRTDTHGKCHDGFKKCGDGVNQQEGAICFPFEEECPITNMLVLPSNESAPVNSFWELAGTFAFNNHTLYVRRKKINELPVVDIVFQLTQFDSRGKNVRGVCYNGPNQMLGDSTTSDHPGGYAYTIVYPPTCNIADTRYTLVDQVPLETHFIHNLQLADPTNTRVVDDCAIGCLGSVYVVHAAFRANENVRSHSNVTLGMYFAREALWRNECELPRVTLYQCKDYATISNAVLVIPIMLWCAYNILMIMSEVEDVRYLLDFVPFAIIGGFVVWHWWLMNQVIKWLLVAVSACIYSFIIHKYVVLRPGVSVIRRSGKHRLYRSDHAPYLTAVFAARQADIAHCIRSAFYPGIADCGKIALQSVVSIAINSYSFYMQYQTLEFIGIRCVGSLHLAVLHTERGKGHPCGWFYV